MTDYTERARAFFEADHGDEASWAQAIMALAAEFAAVAAEAEARGRRQGLEEAANVCGSHYRGYKLAADFITQSDDGPLPEDHKADAVVAAAEAIRALAGGGS